MNSTNNQQILRTLAHQEAEKLLARDPGIEAISIVGSVAYGLTDEYSDIDLLILYKDIPDQKYEKWRETAQGLQPIYVIGGKEHDFLTVGRFVEGIKIDFGRIKVAKFQDSIDAVVKDHKTDLEHQAVLFGINNSEVFYDKGTVATWRKEIEVYPEELIPKTLQSSLTFTPKSVYEGMGLYRNDALFVYECLVEDLKKILQTLFCLNRIYHPGKAKGLNWIIEEQLLIQPHNFLERMLELLNHKQEKGVEEMLQLIVEVYELVQREMPEFNIEAMLKRFEVKLRL